MLSNVQIAHVTHEANRAYCRTLGEEGQVSWDYAPTWQRNSAVTGVEVVRSGEARTPAAQHDAWMRQKLAEGWVYGPMKDAVAKTHPCLLPFDELPPSQQAKDRLFRAVVLALAGS